MSILLVLIVILFCPFVKVCQCIYLFISFHYYYYYYYCHYFTNVAFICLCKCICPSLSRTLSSPHFKNRKGLISSFRVSPENRWTGLQRWEIARQKVKEWMKFTKGPNLFYLIVFVIFEPKPLLYSFSVVSFRN